MSRKILLLLLALVCLSVPVFAQDKTIGRNTNTSDTAVLTIVSSISNSTSVTCAGSNTDRISLDITVDKSTWIKLQAASVDNTQKGILVLSAGTYTMESDNIYTGEVSCQANTAGSIAYITEY